MTMTMYLASHWNHFSALAHMNEYQRLLSTLVSDERIDGSKETAIISNQPCAWGHSVNLRQLLVWPSNEVKRISQWSVVSESGSASPERPVHRAASSFVYISGSLR